MALLIKKEAASSETAPIIVTSSKVLLLDHFSIHGDVYIWSYGKYSRRQFISIVDVIIKAIDIYFCCKSSTCAKPGICDDTIVLHHSKSYCFGHVTNGKVSFQS